MASLYVPVLEDADCMTFQIGMVSHDGIVLGSDRKMTNLLGHRHGRLTPKIEVYENENIAHCSSGDAFCDTFTNVVRKAAKDFVSGSVMEIRKTLIECVQKARAKEKEYRQQLEASGRKTVESIGGNTLLVFREKGGVALWTVDTQALYPNPMQVSVGDKVIAGDTNSAAVFFPERYLSEVPNTINSLIALAVHSVLMAKGEFVEGLTVGVFTRDVFKTLTEEELQPFVERSAEIDSAIMKLLTRH